MTTIVASLEWMAADRFVTYGPSYQGGPKIWTARGSIWGAAGTVSQCLAFKEWTLGRAKKFKFERNDDEDKLEALQLSPDGLFLWVGDRADFVSEGIYGIGSGGGYAVGALSYHAPMQAALDIAAKWDANTRAPFDVLRLCDIKRKRR